MTEIRIPVDAVDLPGRLAVPHDAAGVVVFAHGSGSSRQSPRNRFVAGVLHQARFSTLLFDLLTPTEEVERANVFDIGLLATRLSAATQSLAQRPETARLPIGYFGASTGAAAALAAAAAPSTDVRAIVSRGGRPDLAGDLLPAVRAPVLLIVGGEDTTVLGLNRDAAEQLTCPHRIEIVQGATHLFEEPGTLERAADLARRWFEEHLVGDAPPSPPR
jgi:putative phosphoribosyl transferase